jgi:nitrate reductase NapAB chaperone NapD
LKGEELYDSLPLQGEGQGGDGFIRTIRAMPITSVIVEIKDGSSEKVLAHLARMPQVSVYGMKDSQIVTVIEDSAPAAVDAVVLQISGLEEVIGVYPVYVGGHE